MPTSQNFNADKIALYNQAVSYYQQACKKKKIKTENQKYRHMQSHEERPLLLYVVDHCKFTTSLLTMVNALLTCMGKDLDSDDLVKFVSSVNVTLYRNGYPSMDCTVLSKNHVKIENENQDSISITRDHHLHITGSQNLVNQLLNYGVTEKTPISQFFDLNNLIIQVQDDTLQLLLGK